MSVRIIAICLVGLGFAFALPARAAESYDNCTGFIDSLPTTVSAQGTWCLRKNLSTNLNTGNAVTVSANNVTIDCNNFKIGGLGAGTTTQATGIRASGTTNVIVRHCSVRGFATGIWLDGSYNTVEDSALDLNTVRGIYVVGDGSVIRGNQVSDTGGAPASDGTAYGIQTFNKVDIVDNTVGGVAGSAGTNGNAFGIYTSFNYSGTVADNRVSGLTVSGSGHRFGLFNLNSSHTAVRGNIVSQLVAAVAGDVGIRCTAPDSVARDNMILGYASAGDAVESCTEFLNVSN